MTNRVRLLWVEGDDAADVADLIGTEGDLDRASIDRATLLPDGRGDWLRMKIVSEEVDPKGRLRLSTTLRLTYVFKPL